MWEPQPLATLEDSTACNSDIFTFFYPDDGGRRLLQNIDLYVPHCTLRPRKLLYQSSVKKKIKNKSIPVTDSGGPHVCETSRLPYFLDNELTDGSEVVSPKRRLHVYPQKDSWYLFLLEVVSTPAPYCGWKD
jgi:hypothetical protein